MGDTTVILNASDLLSPEPFAWEKVATSIGADLAAPELGHLATAGAVARGFGDATALVWYGAEGQIRRASYRDLDRASACAADLFVKHGVRPGDRILFVLPLIPELFAGFLGALRAGAVAGVLSAGRNLEAVRTFLPRTRPKIVVTVPALKNMMASLKPDLPEEAVLFYVNRSAFSLPPLAAYERDWSISFGAAEPRPPSFTPAPDSGSIIYFTELERGGAVISHKVALGLTHTAAAALDWVANETICAVLVPGEPLFAPYVLVAPFLAGVTLVCHEDPARFSRQAEVAAERAPRAWFSSFRALDIMLRTDPNLGTLLKGCRSICVIPPAEPGFLYITSLSYGSPIHPVWAPRELNVIQTVELAGKIGSVGRPVAGTEVRIVDASGKALDPGKVGHVAVRLSPGAPFLEFWGDPELTAAHVRDGWFISQQRGRLDGDGALWLMETP
ncbi:MAG: AMP-binding protein [Planctomycetes bacterium]|nr:AMP-binding protein [Planctomycetota bacterium]